MTARPPGSTLTATRFPYTTLFRSRGRPQLRGGWLRTARGTCGAGGRGRVKRSQHWSLQVHRPRAVVEDAVQRVAQGAQQVLGGAVVDVAEDRLVVQQLEIGRAHV